jgi:hypothetical protein
VDALPVIGEDPHLRPRAGHQAELGEFLATEAAGDRPHRLYVDQTGGPSEVEHPLGRLGSVGDRRGVGHGQDAGVAAEAAAAWSR